MEDHWEKCEAVERDPAKLGGAWRFCGTRVPVKTFFDNLEDGATIENFLEWFPSVSREHAEAVLEHAAASLNLPVST